MPWSGGVYTRGYASWVTDANNSLPISATKFDTEDNDFAAGLNNCLTIDGLNKPTANLTYSVQMNWTRATDGNVWSLARTSGSNNPKLQGSVTDATGVTLAVTAGALILNGSGGVQTLGPVAGVGVDVTADTGTFTGTLTGFTSNPTGTCTWTRVGKLVFLNLPILTGTSNATSMTLTGLPAAIQPATLNNMVALPAPSVTNNNSTGQAASAQIAPASGTITFFNPLASSWTASGTKGFSFATTFCYLIN